MELVLVRHGLPVTVANEDGSPADPPLSEAGWAQAERVASWLAGERFDALYASPLMRAFQTAEPLSRTTGLERVPHAGVAEYDQDSAAYMPLEELKRTDYPRWRELMKDNFVGLLDPETFQKQVVEALEEIVARHRGGRVLVVCHGGVINAWASYVVGARQVLFFQPTYTSINRFMAASSGERSIITLNEAAHLREA